MTFLRMDVSTSAHTAKRARKPGKRRQLRFTYGSFEESSAKQAEGLIRLEERLKGLETKQEASSEKLAKKIRCHRDEWLPLPVSPQSLLP